MISRDTSQTNKESTVGYCMLSNELHGYESLILYFFLSIWQKPWPVKLWDHGCKFDFSVNPPLLESWLKQWEEQPWHVMQWMVQLLSHSLHPLHLFLVHDRIVMLVPKWRLHWEIFPTLGNILAALFTIDWLDTLVGTVSATTLLELSLYLLALQQWAIANRSCLFA